MAVFTHMPMGEEGLRQVYSWIDTFVKENSKVAEKISLGKSEDGKWDIPAVVVTNPSIPADEKQNAIITLVRHGQERGARVVGPEILNYLISDDAREIRDKQCVIVLPVANPEGFIKDEFNSSMYGITDLEKKIWGNLCSAYVPDMMTDYHSLGKSSGPKYDRGDVEVILPANTTRWGMDEQVHQYVANKMAEGAAEKGWPYEIHTLEDLSFYYFGDPTGTGRFPQRYMQEKVFLLHIQDHQEQYDAYSNYTNGPAYLKWHALVMGLETNHWAIGVDNGLAESGLAPVQALLHMGNTRFPWEKDSGYPTNILVGDFRISIRPTGKNPGERRTSREKIWRERANFDIIKRGVGDEPTVSTAEIGYIGADAPLDFEVCLRMRQDRIEKVLVEDQEVSFETFKDKCSTFLSIPVTLKKPGLIKIKVIHEPFRRRG